MLYYSGVLFKDGKIMENIKKDYSEILDKEPPSLKVPLSSRERASQYLAFEAVLSGKKLLKMGEEIWLREYAPEDCRREVYNSEKKQEE